ncbi:porin [Povalibacter uvarum]|uniref:Porin n=1 Tax=Povalibacter uvarum TaxID=732238 RepID=A0A841HXJ0_9GAMM|nr:carbohydrate porin [Povalibacter uvarum]MBB6096515.1 porin [Povalibacter uvarum]
MRPPVRRAGPALAMIGVASGICADEVAEPAVALSAVYTADLLRNTSGGLKTGNAYLDNLDMTLSIDGERAFGLPGLTLFAYGLYTNDARFSEVYPGDVMTASNIDAPEALRLYEAWAQWGFGPHDSSLRFGLYDLNSEFDVSAARGVFINSSFGVGHELAQTGLNGPSIFPITSLALRLAIQPTPQWTVLAAVLDGVPGDRNEPTRTGIHLDADEGVLGIAEVAWSGTKLRKLAAGAWRYSEPFERIDETESAGTAFSYGAYALTEFELWTDPRSDAREIAAFFRVGIASDAVNEYDRSTQAGIIFHQPFSNAEEETFGVAISTARVGRSYRHSQEETGVQLSERETAIELTYRRRITDWLLVQPDIQYILNPSADRTLKHALVLGLRFEFLTERSW